MKSSIRELINQRTYKEELVSNADENLRIVEEVCKNFAEKNFCHTIKVFDEEDCVLLYSITVGNKELSREDFDTFFKIVDRIEKITLKSSVGGVVVNIFVKYFVKKETYSLDPIIKSFYQSINK